MPFSSPPVARWLLGIGYAGLAIAGVAFLAEPSQLLHKEMGTVVYGWAAFLVVGGILCLAGTLTRLWIGEFTGLILLFFGNFAWGVVLVGSSTSTNSNPAKYGVVLVSLALCAFAYRWGEIWEKVGRVARRNKAKRKGEPNAV